MSKGLNRIRICSNTLIISFKDHVFMFGIRFESILKHAFVSTVKWICDVREAD